MGGSGTRWNALPVLLPSEIPFDFLDVFIFLVCETSASVALFMYHSVSFFYHISLYLFPICSCQTLVFTFLSFHFLLSFMVPQRSTYLPTPRSLLPSRLASSQKNQFLCSIPGLGGRYL
jgi:hypothetical protein